MTRLLPILLVLTGILVQPAFAVLPDEMLKNPELEARARTISAQLRCLKCQNQSIDESDADIARDLRLVVRERLTKGDTDQQVLDFVVGRFGEFVLLRPKLGLHTVFLWFAPILLLAIGLFSVAYFYRARGRRPAEIPLTDAEKSALNDLMKDR